MKTIDKIKYIALALSAVLFILFIALIELPFSYKAQSLWCPFMKFESFAVLWTVLVLALFVTYSTLHIISLRAKMKEAENKQKYIVLGQKKAGLLKPVMFMVLIFMTVLALFSPFWLIAEATKDSKYIEYVSETNNDISIVIREDGNGRGAIYLKNDSIFIVHKETYKLDEEDRPFSENNYEIEWQSDGATVRIGETEFNIKFE